MVVMIAVSPHPSGPYTSFINLKKGLKKFNCDVIGMSIDANSKKNGYVNINYNEVNDFGNTLLNILRKYEVDIFIPIGYKILDDYLKNIPNDIKIVKRASGITYSNILNNFKDVNHFIATTPRQYRDLKSFGIDQKDITQIPNMVSKRAENNFARKPNKIIYIGRISHPNKGVLFIPFIIKKILKKNKNISIHYYGGGPDLSTLKLLTKILGLNKYSSFHGYHKAVNIQEKISNSSIFLMPSKSEGFGITLIEAMSEGVVPIVTKISGVTDYIVKDGFSGFVVDRKKNEFIEKTEYLINNPELLNKMSRNAIQEVDKKFSTDAVSYQYYSLFKELLNINKGKINYDIKFEEKNIIASKNNNTIIPKIIKEKIPLLIKDLHKIQTIMRQKF